MPAQEISLLKVDIEGYEFELFSAWKVLTHANLASGFPFPHDHVMVALTSAER